MSQTKLSGLELLLLKLFLILFYFNFDVIDNVFFLWIQYCGTFFLSFYLIWFVCQLGRYVIFIIIYEICWLTMEQWHILIKWLIYINSQLFMKMTLPSTQIVRHDLLAIVNQWIPTSVIQDVKLAPKSLDSAARAQACLLSFLLDPTPGISGYRPRLLLL